MNINVHSITFKTLLYLITFSVIFILSVSISIKNIFSSTYLNLEKEKISLIEKNISPSLALNISYDFEEAVKEVANTTIKNKNILLLSVKIDNQKELLFSDSKTSLQEHIKNKEFISTTKLLDPNNHKEIATMTIVYSKAAFNAYMKDLYIWLFWGILTLIFSMALLVFLLIKSLKRVSNLALALNNFNPNKPKELSLDTSSKDEISSIAISANKMVDKLIKHLNYSKKLNQQLSQNQVHLKDAQRIAKVGSWEYNVSEGILHLSDEVYRILGMKKTMNLSWEDSISLISDKDKEYVISVFDNAIKNGSYFDIEYAVNTKNNTQINIHSRGKVRKKANGSTKLTAVSMDITQDTKNKQTIEKLAFFDALTGLANRTLLKDRMHKSIQNAKRDGERMGVFFLDLDHFKLINDTLGHSVGDELLVYISNILKSQIRDSDTLSRLGGDEFLILLPSVKNIDDIDMFASKIQKILENKHDIGSHQLYITSSIGIAVYPEHGDSSDELIRNADTAMYEAKNDGRNRYKIYSQIMGNFVDKQLNLEQDLTEAVKMKDQIEVYYQVKIDAQSKDILGAEALVRWNHPNNGLIFPDDFIYMAESTGLMIELGNIITDQSIAMIKELNAFGVVGFKMAINLSARQFQDAELVPFITKTLKKYNIDPSQVEFEITETISMSNMTNTLRILTELREIGVSIAIDDFGTGHSSLAYLKKFPINTLKIDQSFVRNIIEDDEDRVIAQTIVSMAHSLGFKTVAEGVETQEHVDMLQNMGCDILQGYFYSKPVTKDAFIEFIKEYEINN